MARMSSIIAAVIRGSVGGLTFFAGPYHAIQIRARVSPVQPNTTNQTHVKTGFASAVSAWEQASDADREGWAAYAQTVIKQGPLGPYSPKGRDLAIAQFSIIQYLEAVASVGFVDPASMDPPVTGGVLAISNIGFAGPTLPGIGKVISMDNNNGEDVNVYSVRSLKQSNARNFFKGPFVTSTIEFDSIADAASGEVEFLTLVDAGVYFARIRFISTGNPRRISDDVIVRFVAETNP